MASKKLTSTSRKEKPTEATVTKKEPAKPAKRATVAKKNTSEPGQSSSPSRRAPAYQTTIPRLKF